MLTYLLSLDWPTLIVAAVLGAIAKYIADQIGIRRKVRSERQGVEIERTFAELRQTYGQWQEKKPYQKRCPGDVDENNHFTSLGNCARGRMWISCC